MANHLDLEDAMIEALRRQYKPEKADAFQARYFAAKDKLFREILPWIRANEPSLSDHSERHIDNVLNNAYKLIFNEIEASKLSLSTLGITGLDLYFLCQACLFHDVGNFYGRDGHNQSISQVINKAFSDLFDGEHKREKKLIAEAGKAHTGKDGTDTLIELFNKSEHIQGDHIHYCAIAAIVRFADELAEGPQRTSAFMQSEGMIDEGAKIYHEYASCTHIKIDSPNQRISIQYELNIETNIEADDSMEKIKNLLDMCYRRISKLDQERKYFNYYNNGFSRPIRETQIAFRFSKDEYDLNFKVEPLILKDLVIPRKYDAPPFLDDRQDLKIDCIMKNISEEVFTSEGVL